MTLNLEILEQMKTALDDAYAAGVRNAKREWVGLTPQERDEINEQVYGAVPHHVAFHHAIEAKLKEKNTQQDTNCKYCTNGCAACDARKVTNVLP